MNAFNIEISYLNNILSFIGDNYLNIIATITILIFFYLLRKEYRKKINITEEINEAYSNFYYMINKSTKDINNLFIEHKTKISNELENETINRLDKVTKTINLIFEKYQNTTIDYEKKRIETIDKEIAQPTKAIANRINILSSDVSKVYDAINKANKAIDVVYKEQDKLKYALNRRDKKILELKTNINELENELQNELRNKNAR